MINKNEHGKGSFHGHISALTIAPEYRKCGLARRMMDIYEKMADEYLLVHIRYLEVFKSHNTQCIGSNRSALLKF